MAVAEEVKVIVKAEDQASGTLRSFGGSLSGLQGIAGKLAGIAGIAGLGLALKSSVSAFNESAQASAQLDAVLKSTGGAAGVSKIDILGLATALQSQTMFTDEAVLSAENLLLTFTNIKGDVLEGATKAVLDMSQAMGQDLKSSSIQLGKALNNPIEGMSALTRVGVTFDDKQKKLIETLVKSGKTMEAQKIILGELSKEFGGSATAAASTFQGRITILMNEFGDLQESIGQFIVEAVGPLIDWVFQATRSIGGLGNVAKAFGLGMANVVVGMELLLKRALNQSERWLNDLLGMASDALNKLISFINLTGANLPEVDFRIKFKGFDEDFSRQTLIEIGNSALELGEKTEFAFNKIKDFGIASGDAAGETKKLADAAKKMADDIQSAFEKVGSEIKNVSDAIFNIRKEQADIEFATGQEAVDFRKDMAKSFVEQEKKVADLKSDLEKKKIANVKESGNRESEIRSEFDARKANEMWARFYEEKGKRELEIKDLEDQLTRQQAALERYKTIEMGFVVEVNEARRFESLTSFEKEVENITSKMLQQSKEHEQKMSQLNIELKAKQDQLKALKGLEDELSKKMIESSANRKTTISEHIDSLIRKYQDLAQAAQRALSTPIVNAVSSFTSSVNQSKLPKFAEGGIVPGPIGMPQLAVVHGGETVVPSGRGGIGGISINITGNSFLSEDAPRQIIEKMIDRLKLELRI